MGERWKLEIWLDPTWHPSQVNTVVVDAYNRLLRVSVTALAEDRELTELVEALLSRLGEASPTFPLFDADRTAS